MKEFKKRWEIQKNWQLLFPILGLLALIYSSFKLAKLFIKDNLILNIAITAVITLALLKFILFLFKKLENKWKVDYKWEMIRIFLVFSVTGSSSVFIGRPIIKKMGITEDNLNVFVYWILFVVVAMTFYQILLVCFGWLSGQHKFFWEFEKKMLRRFGLGRFID